MGDHDTNTDPGSTPRSNLRHVIDSVAEGIFCIDLTGRCTFCNARCLELLRFRAADELLGMDIHQMIHHHHRDGSEYPGDECKIRRAYVNKRREHVDDEIFWRADGTRFDAEYWSCPIEEEGKLTGAVISFVDKSAKREEETYRNQLAWLVESSHDAIVSKDLNGVITSWNEGATQIYGFETEEAVGRPISIILPGDRDQEEPEIAEAIRNGTVLKQFEVERRRKNGQTCHIALTVSPIFDLNGELIGASSIERDVTERRRAHDEILTAKSAAEHAESLANAANKARAEFLANVSHELRTPMNAILGMLQLALDEQLDDTVMDYLKTAKSSADSLLELVNEILDFSKIESGKFEIEHSQFDLREAIDSAAKALSPIASEKGLEIFCEIDSDIPKGVVGDRRRLQQVITNLLSNAVKFTEKGEIVVKISQVKRLSNEVRLHFSVSDTGIGIAPPDQELIFSPFAQADMSSTRQYHGTGLGLSICRELISLMGGSLGLESELGKGSNFFFELSLPVHDDSKPVDQFQKQLVHDLKVLIVDDNPTNLRILEKLFVSWSMQPIVADSANQALRILDEAESQGHKISLALIDGLMPKIDGFELAKQVSDKHGIGCPPIVIMQAASDMAIFSNKKQQASVAGYVNKPISQSALLNTIIETLDLYEHQSGLTGSAKEKSKPIQSLRILLAEDLPANQKVAKAILERRGHRVVVAANGRVALEYLQGSANEVDLILMDVQMPVMDGLQATEAIRALSDEPLSTTPVIAMTAHVMDGDREACLDAGMDAYISKPLDAQELIDVAESIARGSPPGSDDPRGPSPRIAIDGRPPCKPKFELVELDVALSRMGGDQELFKEFVDIFMEDAPKLMDSISCATKDCNARGLERAAHALKGLVANFGARPYVELTQRFERAGKNHDIESIVTQLPRLNDLYDQLNLELAGFLEPPNNDS